LFYSAIFDIEVGRKLIVGRKWDHLGAYVDGFLKVGQGESLHRHPYLDITLCEVKAHRLILDFKILHAEVKAKFEALLVKLDEIDTQDNYYMPWDYAKRVKNLNKMLKLGMLFLLMHFLGNVFSISKCSDALMLYMLCTGSAEIAHLHLICPSHFHYIWNCTILKGTYFYHVLCFLQ
jgi:hypothetical protein